MKTARTIIMLLLTISVFVSCTTKKSENNTVVEVVAKDFKFVVQDSLPSGWNRLHFKNTGHAEHFFFLNRLPDSITFDRYHNEVVGPFEIVFDSIKAGMPKDKAFELLGTTLPSWYFTEVKPMGGTGILSMGKESDVYLNLTPGTYAMECYIKEQGVFHTTLGMIKELTVTGEVAKTELPLTNMKMTLKNYEFEVEGALNRGKNIFEVTILEHPEFGLGNDVHIVRLEDDTNLDSVVYWMDWSNVTGLQSPGPAKFYGGIQEMPIGQKGYFTVTLDPGNYAWISEGSAARGMVKKFTVE